MKKKKFAIQRHSEEPAPRENPYEIQSLEKGLACLVHQQTGELCCKHEHPYLQLQTYTHLRQKGEPYCPTCKKEGLAVNTTGIAAKLLADMSEEDVNAALYDTFNSEPDYTAPRMLHQSMYDSYKVESDIKWHSTYDNFGIKEEFLHEDNKTTNKFHLTYDFWRPSGSPKKKLPIAFIYPGVPVSKEEWYDVVAILSRFIEVYPVDPLGMGGSSHPVAFQDADGKWLWTWDLHAEIFKAMIIELIGADKVYLIANDWGTGMVQVYLEKYDNVKGAALNSLVGLNTYWVQQIGGLNALTKVPFPSPQFDAEARRFIGTYTLLVESMGHRTAEIHNQSTMAALQKTYVEISYGDPEKTPDNTRYYSHKVRVLAEQASHLLGKGRLMPFHKEKNPNGLKFTNYNVPIIAIHGAFDKMMPEHVLQRFSNIFGVINLWRKKHEIPSNLNYEYRSLDNAGHFAMTDQPERSADILVDWLRRLEGPENLAQPSQGFREIAGRDEKHVLKSLDRLFRM